MNLESFVSNIEKMTENMRASQTANFEKAFQNNKFKEGTQIRHISTINEGMSGKSVNGVRFARKVFTLNGERVEGVFPVFKSEFNVRMPENLYKASDNMQMKYCTKRLAQKIARSPDFANKFTPRQLDQIRNGEPRISGLTWHHSEVAGKMQLVNAVEHNMARHTGGRSIWGGGSGNR